MPHSDLKVSTISAKSGPHIGEARQKMLLCGGMTVPLAVSALHVVAWLCTASEMVAIVALCNSFVVVGVVCEV